MQDRYTSGQRWIMGAAIALLVLASSAGAEPTTHARQSGTRYSPLKQIDTTTVGNLQIAWHYHTGEVSNDNKVLDAFEDEPTLVAGNLIVCTTTRRIIALDPATGVERWTFDPQVKNAPMRKCRGISTWTDAAAAPGAECRTRILVGTADYRLIAIDAKTGKPCQEFGTNGEVKMPPSKPEIMVGEVAAGSRPAIVNGVVVVGSAVADNQRLDAPSGRVLAFDAKTGQPRWEFDPLPRTTSDPASSTWLDGGTAGIHGGGNVWSEMAVDEALDLVYLPTTSPAVDFYGATRPGANAYANSVVALKGATGEVAWHFQLVHHDIWDYDTPAQPVLVDYPRNGTLVPALVQNTKMGMIFVFDRRTGEPLVPIEERPVPQEGATPGEWLSPTQPFPVGMPALGALGITPDDAWGPVPLETLLCKRRIRELNHGPLYTPPSEKGTIMMPGPGGGANWGGGAYDPATHLMVVPSARVPMIVTMLPSTSVKIDPTQAIESRGAMMFPNTGARYVTKMEPLLSPLFGTPCTAPPWAVLSAVDIVKREIRWQVPLGSIEKLSPVPLPIELGTPGAGGPLVTAGGLAFIGHTLDDKIRAFDLATGKTLWKAELPAAGMATPVSYEVNGEQYIVLTAGGHSMYGSSKGDSVIAWKLKK